MPDHTRFTPYAIALAIVLAGGSASATAADEIDIVRNRVARAYIVVAPDAPPLEKEAATDLQWAVRRAAGVELQLLETPATAGRLVPIRIGQAAGAAMREARDAAWKDLPYDGAVVEVGSEGVTIAGPTPAGTANGVATVLMEDVGVRTYYPDALFTIVPRSRNIRIRSRVVRPSFDYRVWSGLVGPEAGAYRRRNRLSDPRVPVPYFGFGHNLGRIIPVETYGKSHPEYFAFRDGARRPEGTGVGHATQPCFTNAEVIRLTIQAARKYFDEHPERNTFSLCVNDNARYCECETCAALDKPYRDLPVGRQYSESYYDYVLKVAEAIAQSHPDKYLGVYAYWNVEQPPRNRNKLPDNVIVALTLDILQHYAADYREKDRLLVKAWSGCANRLHTYVYYGLGWFTPRTSPRLVAEDLRFCAANGVRAVYCEAYPFWAWCGPMHYVAARLQWDVTEDPDRLLDAFHKDCFEDVAAEMQAFYDACERYWTRPRKARWFEGLDRLGPEEAMADLERLAQARQHLETAMSKTESSRVRRRIAWIREGFGFTMAVADAFEAARKEGASEERLKALISAAEAVEKAHAKIAGNPAYKHTYYQPGPRFERKCWEWFKTRLQRVAMAYHKELGASIPAAEAKARWETFAKESGLAKLLEKRGWQFKLGPTAE